MKSSANACLQYHCRFLFIFQARSEHPTIAEKPFGKDEHCLGVIEELDKEYERNPTLKHKFFWVNQKEYADYRKHCFSPTINQRSEINHALFFIVGRILSVYFRKNHLDSTVRMSWS